MTAPITFRVYLDTDRDFTFDASIDEITSYVTAANWSYGFASPTADVTAYDDVAPPARLTLTLKNDGKEFNPETLGSELLTNGSFANWTSDNPDGWTVTGESGTDPEVSQVGFGEAHGGTLTGACNIYSTSGTVSIAQSGILTVGTTYRLQIKVGHLDLTAGGLRLYCGTQQIGFILQQIGNYTFYFNAKSTGFKIESLLACNVTIDDVSLKAVSLYGRFLYSGAVIKLTGTYNATTYTRFIGTIAKQSGVMFSSLLPGQGGVSGSGASQVTVIVEDGMLNLLDAEYAPPLLTSTTVDAALTRLFDDGVQRYPYGDYGTLLDVQGTNVLDYTARIYGYQTTLLDLETGITTLDYLGDMSDKGTGVSAQGYIRDLLPSEGSGRFYWNAPSGKWTFHNRYHDVLNTTIAGTYTQADFTDMRYSYSDHIINRITINYTSKTIGSANTVVWSYKSVPFQLKHNTTRTFTARYVDPNNDKARIGIKKGTTPVASLDYVANTASDGTGSDVSKKIIMGVEFNAASAKITLINNSFLDVYITTLQLRATPFIWQSVSVTQIDGQSIARYGVTPNQPKTIRALSDAGFAELLAQDWIRRFKQPIASVASVTFNGLTPAANRTMAQTREVADKITLTDTFTGHDADYIIVGAVHQVSQGGNAYSVQWVLKPALRESIYILDQTGSDELDSDNVIGL